MQGPEASSHAHEAGYDAYMTGAAFACLLRLHEAAVSSPGQPVPSPQQQPSLDAVQHLLGRINVGRCAAFGCACLSWASTSDIQGSRE